jgi:CBS domain-containing protein
MGLSEFDEAWEDDLEPAEVDPRRLGETLTGAPIRSLEPRPALTLAPEAPVREALALMTHQAIGAVLVTRDDRPVGIFTERDLMNRVVAAGRSLDTSLGEVMTPDPETLGIDDGIAFALNRMVVGGFRHVPLVDDAGRAVGVLSQREVVAWIVSLLPARVLNLPPEPRLQAHSADGG